MATGVVVWSTTAANNATADSNINWAEGQAPSSVNDSSRAEMSAVAKFRNDINGSITTGGTSTAYTVTTGQSFAALTAGYMVAFAPHATNGATPTINVDGLGAKPLRSAPNTGLTAGVLVQGTPYVATYYTSNSGEWILHGFFSDPYNVPIGALLPYIGTTAPSSNYVLTYGQAISRTTYSALFALCSTAYGTGDGSTTFNVPDIRGRVIAGQDDMGGTSADRLTNQTGGVDGDTLGATGGAETYALSTSEMPVHNHGGSTSTEGNHTHKYDKADNNQGTAAGANNAADNVLTERNTGSDGAHSHSISSAGGSAAHNNVQPTIICNYILRVI